MVQPDNLERGKAGAAGGGRSIGKEHESWAQASLRCTSTLPPQSQAKKKKDSISKKSPERIADLHGAMGGKVEKAISPNDATKNHRGGDHTKP